MAAMTPQDTPLLNLCKQSGVNPHQPYLKWVSTKNENLLAILVMYNMILLNRQVNSLLLSK